MSTDSLAVFRQNLSGDLQKLAEDHFEHDLKQSDRDILNQAAGKVSTHALVGSLLGLSLGAALAWRTRQNRLRLFEAFKTARKPTHVKFADGTEEVIQTSPPLVQPSTAGDLATYTFFSIAGIFIGGESGLLTGASGARRMVMKDPEVKERVERAYRGYKADVLRKEISLLENQGTAKGAGIGGFW